MKRREQVAIVIGIVVIGTLFSGDNRICIRPHEKSAVVKPMLCPEDVKVPDFPVYRHVSVSVPEIVKFGLSEKSRDGHSAFEFFGWHGAPRRILYEIDGKLRGRMRENDSSAIYRSWAVLINEFWRIAVNNVLHYESRRDSSGGSLTRIIHREIYGNCRLVDIRLVRGELGTAATYPNPCSLIDTHLLQLFKENSAGQSSNDKTQGRENTHDAIKGFQFHKPQIGLIHLGLGMLVGFSGLGLFLCRDGWVCACGLAHLP